MRILLTNISNNKTPVILDQGRLWSELVYFIHFIICFIHIGLSSLFPTHHPVALRPQLPLSPRSSQPRRTARTVPWPEHQVGHLLPPGPASWGWRTEGSRSSRRGHPWRVRFKTMVSLVVIGWEGKREKLLQCRLGRWGRISGRGGGGLCGREVERHRETLRDAAPFSCSRVTRHKGRNLLIGVDWQRKCNQHRMSYAIRINNHQR